MTIMQIRAVLLTAELGSISAAAKELNISQPNASNSVRLLEEEIGFAIFHRSSTGAILTQKGEQFMEYARRIIDQNDKILSLRSAEERYRLRVGGVNYNTCIEPLLALCRAHREDEVADFCYYNVSVAEGIQRLVKRELDVVTTPVLAHQVSGLVSECKKNRITMNYIGDIPTVIIVRNGHPAIGKGLCENITQGSDAMKDYPYAAYHNILEDSTNTGYNDSDFAQCSYKIFVDDIDVRLRMIATTNAFGFGARSADTLMERYGLTCFPVPGIIARTYVLTRSGEEDRREIQDYMTELRKELKNVML